MKNLLLIVTALLLSGVVVPVQAQEVVTNEIGMQFQRIEPGQVTVGKMELECPSPPDQRDVSARAQWEPEDFAECERLARRDSRPGFTVTIDEPFYIGTYEVTQEQWENVMGTNPSYFQGDQVEGSTADHPVENISWTQARAFIDKLNEKDPSATYRLPTEFEWEYAARAGADEVLSWSEIQKKAWVSDTDKGTTHPVGQKDPNPWGLYDTLGNVWEWVADYYNQKPVPSPNPPDTGEVHVLKGGSFISDVTSATYFFHGGGPGNGYDVGFRVVREVNQELKFD